MVYAMATDHLGAEDRAEFDAALSGVPQHVQDRARAAAAMGGEVEVF